MENSMGELAQPPDTTIEQGDADTEVNEVPNKTGQVAVKGSLVETLDGTGNDYYAVVSGL